jgi:hypothetical protein
MQSSPLQQKKMRNLSLYEKAGPYNLELMLDAQVRASKEAAVREFLWDHWQQRRLGQVTVTRYSREGEPSASFYFVEPDERGIWRIAVEIDRTLVDRGGSKNQRHESVEYEAYSVERIEVPKDGLTQRVVIPEAEMRSPESYRLALKDQEGKSLTEI